jgi:hypothetical protein
MTIRVKPTTGLPAQARPMSEADFQAAVIKLAGELGWHVSARAWEREAEEARQYGVEPAPLRGLVFHQRISIGSEAGWPDLTFLRRKDGRMFFAELKSQIGSLKPRQVAVIDLLRACGQTVFVWRPSDFDEIARVLL